MLKRITIAFMTNEVEGDYHELLMKGVNDAASKLDVNVIIVAGKALNSHIKYECNHNISYDFINNLNVDGVIMSSGTMAKYIDSSQLVELFQRFTIPTVSIALPFGSYCCIDNKTGLRNGINHLIKVHNKKNIVLITGPDTHNEAIERYNTYLDVLKENNIQFNPNLIIKGDFTYNSAIQGVRTFLAKGILFDSIVSSNDEMATGAIRVLKENNFSVPDKISIIGFDNVSTSLLHSLTTVSQPVYEMGYSSVELLIKAITEKKYESRLLDTELIIRDSCGCFIHTLANDSLLKNTSMNYESFIDEFIMKVSSDIKTIMDVKNFRVFTVHLFNYFKSAQNSSCNEILTLFRDLISILREDECFKLHHALMKLKELVISLDFDPKVVESCFSNLNTVLLEELHKNKVARNRQVLGSIRNLRHVLLALFSTMNDVKHYKKYFFEKLDRINIRNLFVFTYENSFIYHNLEYNLFERPRKLNLFFSRKRLAKNTIQSDNIFSIILNKQRSTYILFPIFFHDEQLGIALYEYPDCWNENSIYETLSVEFSCAIRISLMLNSHKKVENELKYALKEFEEYNDSLNYLSFRDELTSLYNRRGFFKHAPQALELAAKKKGKCFLVFADMDGLKAINDKYGHGEGDIAIKEISSIITNTFSKTDIISRLGGDEFTILAMDVDNYDKKLIYNRIQNLIEYHNNKSTKPYKLSLSIGIIEFDANDTNLSLDTLMKEADDKLYKNKQSKKKDI